MAFTIDDLLNTGEPVFLDTGMRQISTHKSWYKSYLFPKNSFEELDVNALSIIEGSLTCELQDYALPNTKTVNGVVKEKIEFTNILRRKKIALKERNKKTNTKHYSEEQMENIHYLMRQIVELAKSKVYFPNNEEYNEIFNKLKAIKLPSKKENSHTRETDRHLVAAGIHCAQNSQVFIISADKDISYLANQYFKDNQTNFPLNVYLNTINFDLELRACSHY